LRTPYNHRRLGGINPQRNATKSADVAAATGVQHALLQ
jgi:hypothetical protein